MTDGEKAPQKQGWWDWPIGVIAASVVLFFVLGEEGGLLVFVMFWFGLIALLIRRGAFTPRR